MNGQPSCSRQHAPERRLAGAAQANQRDAPRAVGRDVGRGAASISSAIAGSSDGGMRASRSSNAVIAAARPLLRGISSMTGTSSASAIALRMIDRRIALPASICAR